jgi:hypothetical protein
MGGKCMQKNLTYKENKEKFFETQRYKEHGELYGEGAPFRSKAPLCSLCLRV